MHREDQGASFKPNSDFFFFNFPQKPVVLPPSLTRAQSRGEDLKKNITHWRLLRSGWEQQKSCSHGPSRAGKIVTGARGAVFGVFFDGCIFGRFETPLNIPVFLLGRRFRPPRGPWTPPHVAWPQRATQRGLPQRKGAETRC